MFICYVNYVKLVLFFRDIFYLFDFNINRFLARYNERKKSYIVNIIIFDNVAQLFTLFLRLFVVVVS
jgi:hypothetical protein